MAEAQPDDFPEQIAQKIRFGRENKALKEYQSAEEVIKTLHKALFNVLKLGRYASYCPTCTLYTIFK